MSLGGAVLRQHVVEFIDGVGIKTDGIVDTADTATPFSWTVPAGVTRLFVTGCGGGGGGSPGNWDNATTAGGGGGGGAGMGIISWPVDVLPETQLTIAIGAGGPGGASNTYGGTKGGNTTISPVLTPFGNVASNTFSLLGGGSASVANGGNGRTGGLGAQIYTVHGSASGLPGSPVYTLQGHLVLGGGSAGGNANATGSVAGSNGASMNPGWLTVASGITPSGGTGGTTGTKSCGGGGAGAASLFGNGGNGGGNASGTSQSGTNATGYGAGGGAGGGNNGPGGNGTKGYLRFVYWSTD